MATAPSPNDLTRQQLDELDALLQRMLSVPLAPAETPMPFGGPALPLPTQAPEPAPAPPNWRIDPPAPPARMPAPHLAFAEPLAEEMPPPAAPMLVTKAAEKADPSPAPVPSAPPKPHAAPAPKAQRPVTPVPAAPPVPFLFLPFVALNVLFNSVCGLFGPPGRLLRSGFFKYLYGLVGVGLLAYTAAHVGQTQGWLSLPMALPWPR